MKPKLSAPPQSSERFATAESDDTQVVSHLPHFRPRDLLGAFYVSFAIALTGVAVAISMAHHWWLWFAGQILLAVSFQQWFALLHEAGHKTLFRSILPNKIAAHLAGWMSLIPADCWRLVHAKHHYWTGWQDLDVTTQSLVPRRLSRVEQFLVNSCWALWIPLFASLYRLNNYWHPTRLCRLFPDPRHQRLLMFNIGCYAASYLLLVWAMGVGLSVRCFAFGLYLGFAWQDLLILSQHTHIPMNLARGEKVQPFAPHDQEVFTRSLRFPEWFSRLILLNLDAHELHHMFPRIPGYYLHRVELSTMNSIDWWQWILKAKSTRGETLMFHNRDETGYTF